MAKKHDNISFVKQLMTFSGTGALAHVFVFAALDYYSKSILSRKDLEKDMGNIVNPEAWQRCAREVLEKMDHHLEREPSAPDHCPSCGVAPGEKHRGHCNVAHCPKCGHNFYTCHCHLTLAELKQLPLVRWNGESPTSAACREFSLYGKWNKDRFVPCFGQDPQAEEDLDRLFSEGVWDVPEQKWLMPESQDGRPMG